MPLMLVDSGFGDSLGCFWQIKIQGAHTSWEFIWTITTQGNFFLSFPEVFTWAFKRVGVWQWGGDGQESYFHLAQRPTTDEEQKI